PRGARRPRSRDPEGLLRARRRSHRLPDRPARLRGAARPDGAAGTAPGRQDRGRGVRLLRRLRRIGGAASAAVEMAGRLAVLRALEDEPDLRSRAGVLQQIARFLLRVHDIEVEEQGHRPDGAALLVANHVSYLDPLVIMASHPALPVAKEEVRGWPLIGPLCA